VVIRNIIIPDAFLEPKRDEQIAREKAVTQKELKLTAETDNAVVAAERTIDFEVAKVDAQTEQMVAEIAREAENLTITTDAEIDKIRGEYSARTAILDAERTKVLGEAEAGARELVNSEKSKLFKMQLEVFRNDAESFLRYTMSQELNPNLRLRLFQSGPGTLWTNLGDQEMNLFLPVPGEGTPAPRTPGR
jgi:hypothetical protein